MYYKINIKTFRREIELIERVTRIISKYVLELGNGNFILNTFEDKLYKKNIMTGELELVDSDKWWATLV